MKRRSGIVSITKGRMYEIIRAPVITEKSTIISEHNQVSFKVAMDATKPEIKAAIEGLFSVKVMAVNTLRQKGKLKRFRGILGKQSDYKKAIIKTKAPWEFINYGDAADCKKYVDDITAIGKEFKDLLTGKKG